MGKGLFGDCCQHHILEYVISQYQFDKLIKFYKNEYTGKCKIGQQQQQQQSQSGLGTIRGRSRIFLYDSKSRND